ncbi:unnamed protein product [Sphagnum troendelagicum]|uniref:Pinin/SDK/MemA protein domain-containing protein n=1 Tax=Sphagnum troendelagicum TaxID=128251 RepID=A0ABP0UPW5_9BRYO
MARGLALAQSAEDLRREIEELQRQQREITERLRDPRGLRKGGLPGGNARNSGLNAPLGRNASHQGFIRRGEDFNIEDQPPKKRRLLSAVVKVEDEEDTVAEKEKEKEGLDEEQTEKEDADDENDVADRRPTLQRNYNADDSHPLSSEQETLPAEPLPRVLPKINDPNIAKRNRRMFGALIGTLEKFRQEDKKLSGSEAFMRRTDSLKRAEQKAQEESERLRRQEREQLAERRKNDLMLRAKLAAQADEKQLELLFLQWTEHHTHLFSFLRTTAEPAIYFMPAKPSEETDKLFQESQQGLEEWKIKCQNELNEYQKQIAADHLANMELEIERWQSRQAINVSNTHTESDNGRDEGGDPFKSYHTIREHSQGKENIEDGIGQVMAMDKDEEPANVDGEVGEVLLYREDPEETENLEVKGGRSGDGTLNGF